MLGAAAALLSVDALLVMTAELDVVVSSWELGRVVVVVVLSLMMSVGDVASDVATGVSGDEILDVICKN